MYFESIFATISFNLIYMSRSLLITGPTSVGRTQLAYELARRQKGEVINGDKFYFYKEFNIGTGVSDSLNNPDVKKHLYQILNPFDNAPNASEYKDLANIAIDEIGQRYRLPIMEVYPFSYVKRLSEEKDGTELAIFGLIPSLDIDLEEKIRRRGEIMLEEGLLAEIEEALEKGYRNTFVMQNSFIYGPLIKFIDGQISLEKAKEEIIQLCLEREKEVYERFQSIPFIKWITHNSRDIEPSIKRILKWL